MKRIYTTIVYKSTDSTNNEAKRQLATISNRSVLLAEEQTAGRGQRGNGWHSSPGANLTFSIVLFPGRDGIPAVHAREQFAVSMATAEAVCDLLASEGIMARIKWPNDIYVDDRKICGILIENGVYGTGISSIIIGIGLNVNETCFPAFLPNPVSMSECTGRSYPAGEVLKRLIACFDARMEMLRSPAGMAGLKAEFLQKMYLKDVPHLFSDPATGENFTGIIRGVADNACLIVEMLDGRFRQFAFKEISYR